MDFIEFSGKTVEDAITAACEKFVVISDKLEYEIIDKGNTGFLGFNSKPAIIKARIKSENNSESLKTEKVIENKDNNIVKEEKIVREKVVKSLSIGLNISKLMPLFITLISLSLKKENLPKSASHFDGVTIVKFLTLLYSFFLFLYVEALLSINKVGGYAFNCGQLPQACFHLSHV